MTPERALQLTSPVKGFECPLSANTYGVDFLDFKIRDLEDNSTLFHINKATAAKSGAPPSRIVQYHFPRDFLQRKTIGTKLVFRIGPRALEEFRMIERHYFRDKLLKSFDFTFGFVPPNTENSWEAIYDVPKLDPALEQAMLDHPGETTSDSFYFVKNELIMHNKATYAYDK